MNLENIFFYFIFYSILGWIYETVLCSIEEGHSVNRGFLMGPYCPIYGFGSVAFLLIFGKLKNVLLIFVLGATLACSVEYFTSYAMEKLFKARWWDYSKYKYNLNGRICLSATIIFGTFAVILIKFLHPAVSRTFSALPRSLFLAIDATMFAVFLFDLIITLVGMRKIKNRNKDEESFQKMRLKQAFPNFKKSK